MSKLLVGLYGGFLIGILVMVLRGSIIHWAKKSLKVTGIIILAGVPELLKWLWFRVKFAFTNLKYTDLRLTNAYQQFNRLENVFENIEDANSLEEAKNMARLELEEHHLGTDETTIEFGQRHIRELTESLGMESRVYGELKEDMGDN